MEENNNIVDSTDKDGQYCLPTYGIQYPEPLEGAEEPESSRFFRPIRFYNSNSTEEELSEEEEEMDAAVSGSGAGGEPAGELAGESEDAASSSSSSQSDPISVGGVEVKLHNRSLWQAFMDLGNEMIVTKPGRWADACFCYVGSC